MIAKFSQVTAHDGFLKRLLRSLQASTGLRHLVPLLVLLCFSSLTQAQSQTGQNTANVTIPDATAGGPGAWVSSTIMISGAPAGATVTSIDVSFGCVHTYSGDLVVDVNANSNGVPNYHMWNREGGAADNPTRTINDIHTYDGFTVNRTWYLYARDYAAGDTGYINQWSITVHYIVPPPPPVITAPGTASAPGPSIATLTPTMQWQASSGATGYGLYISIGPAFTTLVYENENIGNQTSLVLPAGFLQAGQQYRWNMRAHNASGWSTTYSGRLYFRTLLPAPTLSGPANGATGVSTTPTFTWGSVSGANRYWLMVSTSSSDFPTDPDATSCPGCVSTGVSGNTDATSHTLPNAFPYGGTTRTLNPNTTYYWKVQGWNTNGAQGNYSVVRSFTTGTAVGTPTVSISTPSGNVTVPNGTTSYTFSGSASAPGSTVAAVEWRVTSGNWNTASGTTSWSFTVSNLAVGPNVVDVRSRNTQGTYSTVASRTVTRDGVVLFYLSFPLPNRTPYTAAINSVFDHAMTAPYTANGVVVAYTGERGESQYGQLLATTVQGVPLYGFRQASGANFVINGHYTGAGQPNYLWYDGHSGIDYRTTDQSPSGQIDILAAAGGILHRVAGSVYNTIYIDHLNGYTTHYLHLSNPNVVADNTSVVRGQLIGITGDAGASGSPHLHFEVRLNGIEVDPYGWTGSGPDPYTRATNMNLWNSGSPDATRPTISQFGVTPASVLLGNAFTINYNVSDSGGSGLNQVELWRASVNGTPSDSSWSQLQTTPLSGNGPSGGSFSDIPLAVGNYWYGLHVVDNAGNLMDERMAGRGPIQANVLPLPCPADFNNDGFVNSQDLFDFINAFRFQLPEADFNNDGFINSQDLFDFIAAFTAGC